MTRATETQRHGDEFVERNAWLHLLLGLEVWGRRFDALLDAHCPAGPRPAGEARASDAPLIDFVLGLASMRAALRRTLVAATSEGAGPVAHRPPDRPGGGEWLR